MRILADASLGNLKSLFPAPFEIDEYKNPTELQTRLPLADILICRSTLRVDAALLDQSYLQCVATASSGTDHIDEAYLQTRQITIFDAKGSNAQAVTDYVTSTLAWLEKNTSFSGRQGGVIGHGAVGTLVAKRLRALGYRVKIYDPFKALGNETQQDYCSFDELSECDLLCLHANLHDKAPYPSRNLINAQFLSRLKPGLAIINAARGSIVNEADLLKVQFPIYYCTDVYQNEPNINPEFLTLDNATLLPHIGSGSVYTRDAMGQLVVDNLVSWFSGKGPVTPVPESAKVVAAKARG